MTTQNQHLILAKASDGAIVSKQDTFLHQYSASPTTTKILSATFSSADSSRIAFVTSEGSMQGLFGGHTVVLNMMNKALEKIYKEPFLCEGGVSLNTNDSMMVTGNSNGDLIVRNLLNPEGSPVDAKLNIEDPKKSHESGVSEVILSHAMSAREKSEVTMVRFSVVKRHVLASSYKNGHVVIWDTQSIFTRAQNP